jgi:hypothetical protein
MQYNIPNGDKIYQKAIKCTNIFNCKTLQNLPKIGNFRLKVYHLATQDGLAFQKLFHNPISVSVMMECKAATDETKTTCHRMAEKCRQAG